MWIYYFPKQRKSLEIILNLIIIKGSNIFHKYMHYGLNTAAEAISILAVMKRTVPMPVWYEAY